MKFLKSLVSPKVVPYLFLLLVVAVPVTMTALNKGRLIFQNKAQVPISKFDQLESLNKTILNSISSDRKMIDTSNSTLQVTLAERKQLLTTLLQDSPEDVLRLVFPKKVRDLLSQSYPDYLEKEMDISGKVRITHFDDFKGNKSKTEYQIYNKGLWINLYFIKNNNNDFVTDSVVKGKGVAIGNNVVVEEVSAKNTFPAEYSLEILEKSKNIFVGEQKTLVLLVNFQDSKSEPTTIDEVKTLVFGESGQSVSSFYKENSYGSTWITGEVHGWYTILRGSEPCDYLRWADSADAWASNSGININSFTKKIYVVSDAKCGYSGSALIGGARAWIFNFNLNTYTHEMGHLFGASHASSWTCDTNETNCTAKEYGDHFSVMGHGNGQYPGPYQFNGPHKVSTGWVGSNSIITIEPSTILEESYTLFNLESPSTQHTVLKIPKFDSNEFYYVSYRSPIGFDSTLHPNAVRGVSIHLWDDTLLTNTKFIDATPETPDWFWDATLADGKSYIDHKNQITIKQISRDLDSATVVITTPWSMERSSHLSEWVKLNPLPAGITNHSIATSERFVYVSGGYGYNGTTTDVFASTFNQDGSLAPWKKTTPLPRMTHSHTSVVLDKYLYIFGGNVDGVKSDEVYRAEIQTNDGSLGQWEMLSENKLSTPLFRHKSIKMADSVYIIGGWDSNGVSSKVYRAKFDSTAGKLGVWEYVNDIPDGGIRSISLALLDDKLYVSGQKNQTNNIETIAFSAPLLQNNNIGAWTIQKPSLPLSLGNHALFALEGHILITGGYDSNGKSQKSIYAAKIAPENNLQKWTLDNSLPRQVALHDGFVRNNRIYIIGGEDTSKEYSEERFVKDVYSAEFISLPVTSTPTQIPSPTSTNTTPKIVQVAFTPKTPLLNKNLNIGVRVSDKDLADTHKATISITNPRGGLFTRTKSGFRSTPNSDIVTFIFDYTPTLIGRHNVSISIVDSRGGSTSTRADFIIKSPTSTPTPTPTIILTKTPTVTPKKTLLKITTFPFKKTSTQPSKR